jgi:hypothetical protein
MRRGYFDSFQGSVLVLNSLLLFSEDMCVINEDMIGIAVESSLRMMCYSNENL